MTIDVLYFSLFLIATVGQGQKLDAIVIHNAKTAMEIYVAEWFPEDMEFNESCVAEGCPALKNISICPNEWEINSLRNITEIMNDCMKGSICGIVADARPIKPLIISTDEYLPGIQIDGLIKLEPDTGYLSNISNIEIEIQFKENQQWPLQMTLSIPRLRLYGGLQMDLSIETVFGPPLTASLKGSTYDVGIQFISTVYVNKTLTGPYNDIKFVNPIVRVRPLFCGIDMPSGFPDILSLLTSQAQVIVESSTLAKATGKFLEKLYRAVIQVVTNNCKPIDYTT